MTSQPPLTDKDRADLISYLDGELDAQTARALEARLARDPSARAEADTLRRTWELLDYLPRAEPSPDFTHRTVESAAAVPPAAAGTAVKRWPRWRKPLGWAAAVFLAWIVGFAAVFGYARWMQSRDKLDPILVTDLRIIDNLRTYQWVEDIQLLRALDTPELFAESSVRGSVAPNATPPPVWPAPELEQNRRLLERWRLDPEHYARLRQDLDVFRSLPAEQQDRLRLLDRTLHEDDTKATQRLQGVFDRYVSWMERLAEEDRQRVRDAGSTFDRLTVIQGMREREWIAQQPRARREKILGTRDSIDRAKLVARYREEELAFRQQWAHVLRPRGPGEGPRGQLLVLADFPQDVQDFVTRSLRPLLTNEERIRVDEAEGQGMVFVRTLLELTEEHAYAIPGAASRPTLPKDLPPVLRRDWRTRNLADPDWIRVAAAQNKNPDFALAVCAVVRKQKIAAAQLAGTPCHPGDFEGATRDLLAPKQVPALSRTERDHLHSLEGQWPEYPRELVELVRKKQLRVPGLTLPPGAPEFWDRIAVGLPEVPKPALDEFANQYLTREEINDLARLVREPSSRDWLCELYYQRNPGQLRERLRAEYERLLRKSTAAGAEQ